MQVDLYNGHKTVVVVLFCTNNIPFTSKNKHNDNGTCVIKVCYKQNPQFLSGDNG